MDLLPNCGSFHESTKMSEPMKMNINLAYYCSKFRPLMGELWKEGEVMMQGVWTILDTDFVC